MRRQWGTETLTDPLSFFHDQPTTRKIALSRLSIVLTIIFWLLYLSSVIIRQLIEGPQSYQFTMEVVGYLVVVTFLTFSALMCLVARQGAFQRFSQHVRVPRAVLDKHFDNHQPAITVLVPSYSEEPDVVRKTLLSAALQEYPDIRVVLLVDDNPHPTHPDKLAKLEATRALADEIQQQLAEPFVRFTGALERFKNSSKRVNFEMIKKLADEYQWAADWLNSWGDTIEINDHVDIFFVDQVVRNLAQDLALVSQALLTSIEDEAQLSYQRLHQLHRRLVWIFGSKLEIFERKRYTSLSHEPNKAMNLNSYIGLMGQSYRQEKTPDGLVLIPTTKPTAADVTIPDSEFLLTLDADSILLKDYCLRLVYFLQQPDNADVAVTQTPYSSFRGAPSRIERLSGATTDIQHILHQGMSHYSNSKYETLN